MWVQSDVSSCLQSVGGSAKDCPLIDAIFQDQNRCCSVNIVVGFAENIIATVTDSAQLEKNNELMKYIKNSDCRRARAIIGPPEHIDCAAEGGAIVAAPGP